MNFEMFMQLIKTLEGIRAELHMQNIINAERNMTLDYGGDLPRSREFLNNEAKGDAK